MGPAALWSALASLAACILTYDEYDPAPVPGPPVSGVDADGTPPGSPADASSPNVGGASDPADSGALPGAPGAVATDAGVSGDGGVARPGVVVGCPAAGCGAPEACDGGSCAPGRACERDTDCLSGACEEGRCCGESLGDCTRCAERLSLSVDCEAPPLGLEPTDVSNCRAFLACLAEHDELCLTRSAPGCSGDDPAAVCPEEDFGGRTGAGVMRALRVLQSAGCQL